MGSLIGMADHGEGPVQEGIAAFLTLAETRSFHRAAEVLGVSQSTVSARLAALEAALGVRLFERSRAGSRLSPEGERFAPHARALRHEWTEALRRVPVPRHAAQAVRVGLQADLASLHLGDWAAGFRRALPDAAIYLEADYSAQMCADLLGGGLDFAVLFSPRADPDLHFEGLGELPYVMVAREARRLDEVDPKRFVFAAISPAFAALHRQVTPDLADAPLSTGTSAGVVALLRAMGGAGYVPQELAAGLAAEGLARVEDAPVLRQPVFAAMHLRHRTAPLHRRLRRVVGRRIGAG